MDNEQLLHILISKPLTMMTSNKVLSHIKIFVLVFTLVMVSIVVGYLVKSGQHVQADATSWIIVDFDILNESLKAGEYVLRPTLTGSSPTPKLGGGNTTIENDGSSVLPVGIEEYNNVRVEIIIEDRKTGNEVARFCSEQYPLIKVLGPSSPFTVNSDPNGRTIFDQEAQERCKEELRRGDEGKIIFDLKIKGPAGAVVSFTGPAPALYPHTRNTARELNIPRDVGKHNILVGRNIEPGFLRAMDPCQGKRPVSFNDIIESNSNRSPIIFVVTCNKEGE